MAVHGVNDDSDFRRRGHVDGKVVLAIKEGDARICRVISPLTWIYHPSDCYVTVAADPGPHQ